MNLKPMDENTLAFLLDLVADYENTLSEHRDSNDDFLSGWKGAAEVILELAITHFSDLEYPIESDYLTFMEAIKNADTEQ